MADTDPPPDIQESARIFRAWTDANPGEIPPADVHAHALKVQNYLRTQGAANSQPQRVESAIERFKRLVREDAPPAMPAWDPALAGNSQSQSVERAVDRFRRAREIDQSQMPPWRDPRGAG
jgi:MoxR-like ATPase